MGRINQSIEAFVYCILAAQAGTFASDSILGNTGSAVQAQRNFITLVEDYIVTPDISKSVKRFSTPSTSLASAKTLTPALGAGSCPPTLSSTP